MHPPPLLLLTTVFIIFTILLLVSAEPREGGGRHRGGGGNGGNGRRGAAVQRALVNTLCSIEQPLLKSEMVRARDCKECTGKCPTSRGVNGDTAKCFADCAVKAPDAIGSGTASASAPASAGSFGGSSRRRQATPFRAIFRSGFCRDLFGCYRENCTANSNRSGGGSRRNNQQQQQQRQAGGADFSTALAQRQVCVKEQCQERLNACQSDAMIVQLCNHQKCLVPCLQKCDQDCADVCQGSDSNSSGRHSNF